MAIPPVDTENIIRGLMRAGASHADTISMIEKYLGKPKPPGPPMPFRTAVEIMISTMHNPTGPQSCALKFYHAAGRFRWETEKHNDSPSELRQFLESYPDVMRATIAFLTRKQPSADHIAMLKHLQKCRCDTSDREAYDMLHHSPTGCNDTRLYLFDERVFYIYCALAFLIDCLLLVLGNMTPGKFRKTHSRSDPTSSRSSEQPWPHGIDDLLPHGLADSVDGLDLWAADEHRGHLFLRLAGAIARFYPSFGVAIMSKGPDFSLGLLRPTQHLSSAMDAYDKRPSWWQPSGDDPRFGVRLLYVLHFINALSNCDARPYVAMMGSAFAKQALLPVLLRGIGILGLADINPHFPQEFIDMSLVMAVINRKPQDTRTLPKKLTDLIGECFKALRLAHQGGCFNITCLPKSGLVRDRQCAKCDLIRYCDKKCQTEAWKDPKFPHKAVCATIKYLREGLGSEIWGCVVTPTPLFTITDFKKACKQKNIDMRFVKGVGAHIICVQSSQICYRAMNHS
ncbi:hypothetical protein DFP72DRAFT_152088 [Ephemerocybe angulata]|uniref:MYND-type domain-containing protein n=1 Tax=Ephemerocybe angulata TaxID=980116 RepID=A0A8H6H9T7_9AGAR|nr:hypothetical protein DFP72DRAFT_152088 [Tulosesus angulatus]